MIPEAIRNVVGIVTIGKNNLVTQEDTMSQWSMNVIILERADLPAGVAKIAWNITVADLAEDTENLKRMTDLTIEPQENLINAFVLTLKVLILIDLIPLVSTLVGEVLAGDRILRTRIVSKSPLRKVDIMIWRRLSPLACHFLIIVLSLASTWTVWP